MLLVLFRSFVLVWFLFTAVVSVGSFLGGSKVAADGFVLIYGRRCRRRPKQCSFCSLRLSQTLLDRLHQRRSIQFRFCVSNLTSYHRIGWIAVLSLISWFYSRFVEICKVQSFGFTSSALSLICLYPIQPSVNEFGMSWLEMTILAVSCGLGKLFRYRSSTDEYVLVYDLL